MKLGRESEIIFDRICRSQNFGVLTADDGPNHVHLDLEGQTGRTTIDVIFVRTDAFGFEENLVTLLFGKLDDFIFDGGTIARTDAFDLPGIHGRFVEVLADDLGRLFSCESDMARQLAIDPVQDGTRRILAVENNSRLAAEHGIVPCGTNRPSKR